MNILKSIVFGIIEGITEWLPISSTGHLIIYNAIMPMDVSAGFYAVYEVVIQFGAVCAALLYYFNKIWPFGVTKTPLGNFGILKYCKKKTFTLWVKIAISCIPAIIVGLLFGEWLDEHLYNPTVVGISLIVVGIAFIVIETLNSKKEAKINRISQIGFSTAFYIGLFQVLAAIFPGTSRSGAIIIGALVLGVNRTIASEYTFILAIPVMFGASLLKIFKYGLAFSLSEIMIMLVGCISAFVVSIFVIKLMLNYVRKNKFTIFGIYRIILGIIVLICLH